MRSKKSHNFLRGAEEERRKRVGRGGREKEERKRKRKEREGRREKEERKRKRKKRRKREGRREDYVDIMRRCILSYD